MTEAMFYHQENDKLICDLCPHRCRISNGQVGICGVRKNEADKLISLSYGRICAANVDPIEKKPLFHFLPSSLSFSIATPGCNFRCQFCQNWQISQIKEGILRAEQISACEIVELAKKYECSSISYTYTEPTIFYEFALECSVLAKEKNLANIFVTNGYINPEPLKKIAPYLDAANVDLKAFREKTYRDVCGGSLKPVLETISLMYSLGIWLEVTTLIIPGVNDSPEELGDIAEFIASLNVDIPWHISAFHPDYRMLDKKPASLQTLLEAEVIGRKAGLRYVYIGNVTREANTYCPSCGMLLVRRIGFNVLENYLSINDGRCPNCSFEVRGIWINSIGKHG